MELIQNLSPELINAIAGLWKLAGVLLGFFVLLLFRAPIKAQLIRLTRFSLRRGDTELKVESAEVTPLPPSLPSTAEPEAIDKSEQEVLPAVVENEAGSFAKMLDAFFERRLEDAHAAFETLQSSESNPTERLRNEVLYHYLRYTRANEPSSILELERLTTNPEIRALAFSWLARCHQHVRAYDKAIPAIRSAIDSSASESDRADHSAVLVNMLTEMGDHKAALEAASTGLRSVHTPNSRGPLYRALASVLKQTGDKLGRAIALEKALEVNPNDVALRFETAYAQSEAELSESSVVNYDTLIRQEPDYSSAQNNLGVEVSRLDMPMRSVRFYKASADKHETLAMANLSYLFINSGFQEEAQRTLAAASGETEVHQNVGEASAELARRIDAEDSRWNRVIDQGVQQKLFLQAFAEQRFSSEASKGILDGVWQLPDGQRFRVVEEQGQFVTEWGTGASRRRMEGRIKSGSADVKLRKWQSSWLSEQQGYFDAGDSGLAYLSRDGTVLSLMIRAKGGPDFLELRRVPEEVGS